MHLGPNTGRGILEHFKRRGTNFRNFNVVLISCSYYFDLLLIWNFLISNSSHNNDSTTGPVHITRDCKVKCKELAQNTRRREDLVIVAERGILQESKVTTYSGKTLSESTG
jgi:hypothetical protein